MGNPFGSLLYETEKKGITLGNASHSLQGTDYGGYRHQRGIFLAILARLRIRKGSRSWIEPREGSIADKEPPAIKKKRQTL